VNSGIFDKVKFIEGVLPQRKALQGNRINIPHWYSWKLKRESALIL